MQLFEAYLGAATTGRVGAQHVLNAEYFKRIDALNYTMVHDAGQHVEGLEEAVVVLVGVSRTSKTPTSIYLANRGIKCANVPIVPGIPLPQALFAHSRALVIGLTYYSYAPFVKAGLPVQSLPTPKEGVYVSGGSGHLIVLKNSAHPNATKLFINWFLSREGQEVYTRSMHQASRRLDVDGKWLREFGVIPAKDSLTLEQYHKLENQSETKINRLREPAAALARKLFGS